MTDLLNLAKYKCAHFMIEGSLKLPDGPKFFDEHFGRKVTPKNPYYCSGGYELDKEQYFVQLSIEREKKVYQLILHFDWSTDDHQEPSEIETISSLIESLEQKELGTTLRYDVVFEFSQSSAQKFFPVKLPIPTDSLIDEFRGFRGIKRRSKSVVYDISIESPELKELYINIQFHYKDLLALSSFDKRLQEAASIVRGIVPSNEWES